MLDPGPELERALAALDERSLRERYLAQGRFLFVERFLSEPLLDAWRAGLERLLPHVHRNWLPRHKKGGSVGRDAIRRRAPAIDAVYTDPALAAFVRAVVGEPVRTCPESDLHACALYCYTEPGDHIGFHYDTSYYRGRRYTVLLGLVDESSSVLECRLFTRERGRAVETLEVHTTPGSLVLFDGAAVQHRITPLGPGERRFAVTMEYLTSADMGPVGRFVSDMKDALAYFGFRQVFARRAHAESLPS